MSLLLALTASGGGPVNYTLVCDAGAYSLAGQDAVLTRGYALTCDAGAYVLSGQDAALKRGYTLVCDVGAYSLSGQDAVLTYTPGVGAVNYTLTCDAGEYVLAGQDATLLYSSGIQAAPRRHAGTRKQYLIKGQKYLLDDRELAIKVREMLTVISDVQYIKKGKKKQLSPQYWAAIESLVTEKVFVIEDDSDDEEAILMMF